MRRVTEWNQSLPMTEKGWTTLNMLGRGLGSNLTNLYPNGKVLGEALEHMVDYLSENGIVRSSECFRYFPLINDLKSSSSGPKKKNDGNDSRVTETALPCQIEKGAPHPL